jgi:TRAP-type C4-dicarboxylate transport system permease small subunit
MTSTAPATRTLLDRFCRLLDLTSALALAVMAAMVFGNVVLRYGFNSGIAVSEELSRWLFVWMTFLGALVALKENGHLGTDMLTSRLGRTGRRVCMGLSQLLMLGCTVMLFQGSLAQVKINLEVEAPVTGAPMAVVYAAGMAFAVPAIGLLLWQLWRTVSNRLADDELLMVQESEDLAALQSHGQADRR